jgi:hypothetical protein
VQHFQAQGEANVVDRITTLKSSQQEFARKNLTKIISSLRFLARQGVAIRGHSDIESNFRLLLKLREQDCDDLQEWMRKERSYSSPEIQNEILLLMAHHLLRDLLSRVRRCLPFAIMVDGTQDCRSLEQESICVRYVDENLKPQEVFVGLFMTDSTSGDAMKKLIVDALIRLELPLLSLRGQTFDGAANMAGIRNGAQALIREDNPLAIFVHCGSHCTNLVAQSSCDASTVVRDILLYVNDLGVLLHQSGKTKSALKHVIASSNPGASVEAVRPLCPTRWTVRAAALRTVRDQLEYILAALVDISKERGDVAVRASGLHSTFSKGVHMLGLLMALSIFEPLEELCIALQSESQTVSGMKRAVDAVISCLESLRTKEAFSDILLHAKAAVTKLDLKEICIPRPRRPPRRNDSGGDEYQAQSVEDHFRAEFFKVIDMAAEQLKDRFHQPGIMQYMKIEQCLLDSNENMDVLLPYPEINISRLRVQLGLFQMQYQFCNVTQASEVLRSMTPECRALFCHVEVLVKLLLVVPASSATAERSFSTLRKLKTWLRSTMTQARLNHLCLLNVHSDALDSLDMRAVAADFANKNEGRMATFGKF